MVCEFMSQGLSMVRATHCYPCGKEADPGPAVCDAAPSSPPGRLPHQRHTVCTQQGSIKLDPHTNIHPSFVLQYSIPLSFAFF